MEMWQFSRQKDSGMLVARIEYAVMPIIYGLLLHINSGVEYSFVCLCQGCHDLHKDERLRAPHFSFYIRTANWSHGKKKLLINRYEKHQTFRCHRNDDHLRNDVRADRQLSQGFVHKCHNQHKWNGAIPQTKPLRCICRGCTEKSSSG